MPCSDRWQVLWLIAFSRIAMGFQFQSMGAIAPVLGREIDLPLSQLGSIVGAFLLPGVVLSLPGALLGNRLGERRTMVVGLLLMAAGGVWCALARDAQTLWWARLLAGAGGVLFNVVGTKIVADWFGRHEIALAMSIYIGTWPLGMALALLGLGGLAESMSTTMAFLATSLLACAGVIAMLVRPLSAPASTAVAPVGLTQLSAREWLVAVLLAGCAWGLYNVALAGLSSFLPTVFSERGLPPAQAGAVSMALLVGIILSIVVSGWISARIRHPDLLAFGGMGCWVLSIAALLLGGPPAVCLLIGGIVGGLAAGTLVSQPALLLRPSVRAAGTGAFYTVYYVVVALTPREIGRYADFHGSSEGILIAVNAIIIATMGLLALVRLLQRRPAVHAPV